jgi:hypothetical protein
MGYMSIISYITKKNIKKTMRSHWLFIPRYRFQNAHVYWYINAYHFQLGIKEYYLIPLHYMEMSIPRLLEPAPYICFFGFVAVIMASEKIRDRFKPVMLVAAGITASVLVILWALQHLESDSVKQLVLDKKRYTFAVVSTGVTLGVMAVFKKSATPSFRYFSAASLLILFTFFSSEIGALVSSGKKSYYIIEKQEERVIHGQKKKVRIRKVVLDTYQDFYIAAPMNNDRTYLPQFELIKMEPEDEPKGERPPLSNGNEHKQMVLKYEEIGPIRPKYP